MSLKLYIDYLSQPARAIICFCLLNKIPHSINEIRINKFQNHTEEYEKINPLKKIPAISDNGFYLYESHAILRYLTRSRNCASHWYPYKNPKEVALIDAYLDVHHNILRPNAAMLVFYSEFAKKLGILHHKVDLDEKRIELNKILSIIENTYLKDSDWIASKNNISIADISAFCEIIQLLFVRFNFDDFPLIKSWMKRMLNFEEVYNTHNFFFKALRNFNPEGVLEWNKSPRI